MKKQILTEEISKMRSMMGLEETEMDIVEVDDELAIKTCKMYNYKYAVVTPDDIVIPPKHVSISQD
jgi:hypothetical protein